jgi:CDP-Glycerol:Poly(glycerophosphate) glycerophosphotransferase
VSALGSAFDIILTRGRGRSLARRIAGETLTTPTPVAVYFADARESLYQLRRWYPVLEALNAEYPTAIITSDPTTYNTVRRETKLAVTYASGAPELTRVLARQQVRLVLYPNHNALNFRVLRFPTPVHIFIGHGESGKESSVSRQLKAYDRTFVADSESIAQLRTIRGYDADANAVVIGSPWLGFLGAPPTSWVADDRTVVLYAPTWEGDRPSMDYSSVESLGDSIVTAVLGSPGLRLIYRPHPWLGRVRPATAAADARLRRAIVAAGRGDTVDTGAYGWSLGVADVCVTDVSSVAHDARALGKPLLLTVPAGTAVPPTPDASFAGAIRLDASEDAASIHARLEQAIAAGATSPAASSVSMDALRAAVGDALRLADASTL